MKKNLLFAILLFSQLLQSQTTIEIDSLFKIVSTTKNDSVKVSVLNNLARYYIFNDVAKAKQLLKKSEKIAVSKKLLSGQNEILNTTGILNDVSGNSDSAYYYFNKSYQFSKKHQLKNMEVKSVNNLGMYFWNSGQFDKALNNFFQALKINEKLPQEQQIKYSTCYSNIGLIYQEIDLDEKALVYHKKAYEYRLNNNLKHELATSLNNIGICYHALNKNQLAIDTYKKGIQYAKEFNNNNEYCKLTENIANALQSQKKFNESISYYLEIENNEELSPKMKIGIYTGLIAANNELNRPKKGVEYIEKGLSLLKSNPEIRIFSDSFFQHTAQNYFMHGDFKNGEKYNNEFIAVTKEVFSKDNSKQIANYEIKYQTEKKEKELLKSKALNAKKELEIKKKTDQIIIATILAIGFLTIGFLLYRQQKLKNDQQTQEFELKSAIEKIETQNKLQEQRLSISRDLHDNIGSQLTFIISSVDNVKHGFNIQNEKLDNKLTTISSFAKETIVELRDTIWAMNYAELTFEDLEIRISNFIEKAKEAKDTIGFSFKIDDDIKSQKLTSIQGMNIYRTIQEAINNSLKYAQADAITVTIKKLENQTEIVITDNGNGFDLSRIEKGNGLNNMQKRIEEIGGKFDIKSTIEGTIVEILI